MTESKARKQAAENLGVLMTGFLLAFSAFATVCVVAVAWERWVIAAVAVLLALAVVLVGVFAVLVSTMATTKVLGDRVLEELRKKKS